MKESVSPRGVLALKLMEVVEVLARNVRASRTQSLAEAPDPTTLIAAEEKPAAGVPLMVTFTMGLARSPLAAEQLPSVNDNV
jgi:hypothetical protein